MIYPNTQPSGVVGGNSGQDNKRRLQQLLSKTGALPLFGSSGKSASVASLPNVGAPALSFNPFLKMLAGHPGETLANLPANNPLGGFVGSSVPTTSGAASQGVAAPAAQASANPFDNASQSYAPTSHFNDSYDPSGGGPQVGVYAPQTSPQTPAAALAAQGITSSSPLYHTLLQLAMYGYDS